VLARAINWLVAVTLALAATAAAAEPARLMLLGDSLMAGYGLPAAQGFAPRLQAALKARGLDVVVLNAAVSGDTTAGGLARLDWALADRPTHAIVELGANDALRGLDPAAARRNLDQILARLATEGVPVLLAGMLAPRNLGTEYQREFDTIFPDLAAKHGVPLHPFFLDGVATVAALNQADGIHPNAAGVERVVAGILPAVLGLLGR
jgi:acyl-CoA thioesterase-1